MKMIIGGSDSVNRKVVENTSVNILLSPEKGRNKDFMKSRNSGLNQVLCKLAAKNNVAIGFNFDDILNNNDRVNILGRMMLNVRLCNKYGVKMYVCNSQKDFRCDSDLKIFGRILGMKNFGIKRI
ncbi:hypothetical protein J4446_02660 [Candidatus Woesearchaeota archaeon]|nr:hypothetical protein [Candidatus Woesearchaeota archaeon]